ncbi:lipoprotein-releasing ABC transporter ATP-binding protein LolD [Hydrocarboniclastica marina]|uniref:Lipoprotein-releasing system ATP-binding protein LolD n=1 Tax=Hydrocarboniclastica marina TaxID=2259620 RepID=A0A4P7XH15_9ALTE|nr:lipoprotein-releasing ABC transporter ATP-binding protein LolD [Hydrocarboniclastica marina]QCF26319.1 lipoprotein-releasing ABC transporter ATP-binding protein LolD [Hydrocarboniclastica marina]
MNNQLIIDCRGVAKTYDEGAGELTVFHDIDLQLHAGETLAIIGSSGAGKTTLLNMLGGLDKPSRGEVWVAGENLHAMREKPRSRFRNKTLGFVYQFHHLLPEFSALENVAMPCLLGGMSVSEATQRARALLTQVGLAPRLKHKPGELSGGERQRVAIARALVNQPRCVLMDEPTGNLDEQTADQVQALIQELTEELQTAFVVVTHDHRLARRMQRVSRLDHGRLVFDAVAGEA